MVIQARIIAAAINPKWISPGALMPCDRVQFPGRHGMQGHNVLVGCRPNQVGSIRNYRVECKVITSW